MIKKLTEKEVNRRSCKYMLMFTFGSVFFILAIFSIFDIISPEGSEMLVFGIYGLPVLIFGMIFMIDLEEQRDHPENYTYCKKCKKIIRKKHKFCSGCRCSIKEALNKTENKKHFKDYKKFYKGEKK